MKNCTPLAACSSVSVCGLVGLLDESPFAEDEKVPV